MHLRTVGFSVLATLVCTPFALAQGQQQQAQSQPFTAADKAAFFARMPKMTPAKHAQMLSAQARFGKAPHHLPAIKTAAASNTVVPLNLPSVDNSLWYRYYQGGEQALVKHDADTAKRYFFAALDELSKAKSISKTDGFYLVKLSALDQYLEDGYPKDWAKPITDSKGKTLSEDDVMKLRGEQVQTLYRISQVNAKFVSPTDLLRTCENKRYQDARTAYLKAQDEQKKKVSNSNTTVAQ